MNKLYNDTAVQAIANAIRAKNGSSDTYTIAEMSTALNDISYYAKPTISNVALATFEADGLPLNKLKVGINAVQSGSGEPSPTNIRPISGWDEANVSDASEDFFDATGTITQTPSATVTVVNTKTINVKGIGAGTYPSSKQLLSEYSLTNGKTYKIRAYASVSSGKPIIAIRNSSNSIIARTDSSATGSGILEMKFTYDSETMNYISFFSNYGEAGGDVTYSDIMFAEVVTTTISLGQTVYGGWVDVVNGVLTITHEYIASYNGETLPSTWISSMDEYAEGTTPTIGAEVCYELANPISTNLTPTLIKSLNGQNNLSVDCGEVIELEYFKEV